jgi:hypothetical protein
VFSGLSVHLFIQELLSRQISQNLTRARGQAKISEKEKESEAKSSGKEEIKDEAPLPPLQAVVLYDCTPKCKLNFCVIFF